MHVIPEDSIGERELHMASGPGSVAVGGISDGSRTFVCGRCRDILAPGLDLDEGIAWSYDEQADTFTPVSRFRDIVIKCKGCGAYNEAPAGLRRVRRPGWGSR